MTTSSKPIRILLTGLDAPSASPHVNIPVPEIEKMLYASLDEVKADPYTDIDVCWLSLADKNPSERITKYLQEAKEPYDGVLIGWGVRGYPQFSVLLEDCVETVRDNSPKSTRFLFSQSPTDHLETIHRKFNIKSNSA